ncbi:SurA N-terminal domain-containing protein [Marinimicrobium sp. C6131]|uniref:SurA N-terminal domain-containing protein n=1 Tax=Marinimicrobium sp. C6131 TaxID=3022676 RepID=UPI00223DFCB4|nr:SurA N-terminal domain-containing protein [Marinimicrobium sp. C6131]UZJ45478.1 SurA N-terminal domain-containing protein [Marinimicrobium sp. C6131]
MLQTIRDNSKGVVAGILVGFLVIIFALSGAEALFSGSSRSGEVVSVDGESITENEVAREIYRQRQQILNQYGDSVPSEFVSDERLREPAVEALIQRKVLIQHARKQGMGVSESTLDQLILSFPQFAGEDGQFDPNRYQQVLRSMGYTPAQYKSLLRQELLLNQLSSGVASSGFVTQDELERFAALNFQSRDFQYATLTRDRVADEVEVTDSDIEAYYQSNQPQFRQPEQVAVDYIDLSVANLMADIEIDEQTLRDQFEQNQSAQESQEAERRVAHILLEDPSDERIAEVQAALEEGASFAELAEQYSDDLGSSGQGGDLGFVSGEGLPEAFMVAVNSLEVGEVSAPVETDAGVHLITVTEERGTEETTFEEARERIAQQLKRVEAENEFVTLMERLGELSYNADSLQSVAEELNLPLENTGLFGRSGGSGVAAETAVVEAAFSEEVLERDNSSDLIELANDRVVVIKKTDHQEAYIKPLEEVRDQIARQLRNERIQSLLAERGEALRQAVASGQSLSAVAEEAGLEVQTAEGVERRASELDRSLVQHVFSLPKPSGEPVVSGVPTRNGYAVVVLTQAQDGEWRELSEEEQRSLRRNLAQMRGQQEYLAYREQLRQDVTVER